MTKITTKDFIQRSKEIHNNKYDYSKTIYIKSCLKVEIICPIHGPFLQKANHHLSGSGCAKCKGKNRTTKSFIKELKEVHGNKYNYSKTIYTKILNKITIICPIHGEFEQIASHHLRGAGCSKCGAEINSQNRTLSQDEVIKRFKTVHKNKYDYSKVEYKNYNHKVEIICPIHGSFWQLPRAHMIGGGCRKCAGSYPLDTKSFIKKAKQVHNNKYNYSKVEYKNAKTLVNIICNKCKYEFQQTPNAHLKGNGCKKCAGIEKLTTKEFIKRSNITHNNKYDYSKSVYDGIGIKLIIICPIHGEFTQTPWQHMKGAGCIKCGGTARLTTAEFITRAKEIHNDKYDYSKVKYKNIKTKVKIICPSHGEFKQYPGNHLSGQGCSKCRGPISKISQEWLDELNIPKENREQPLKVLNHTYIVDAIDEKNKIVYEFYGDFWHGNPKLFNKNDINTVNKKTFGKLYNETLKRENLIRKAGYKIISIWESDYEKDYNKRIHATREKNSQ